MATSITASSAAPNVFASTPQFTRPTFLMCPPEWYGVDYVLNPWMAGNVHRSSRDLAFAQWKGMHNVLRSVADVRLLHPEPGCPDMVFVAHSALIHNGVAARLQLQPPAAPRRNRLPPPLAPLPGLPPLGNSPRNSLRRRRRRWPSTTTAPLSGPPTAFAPAAPPTAM